MPDPSAAPPSSPSLLPEASAERPAEPPWARLEGRVRLVWFAEQLVQGLILLGLAAALDHFVAARALPALPRGALTGGVFVLVAAAAALLPGAWYRRWRYAVTEEALFAERGLLTRVRTVVPLGRIQHLDVRDGVVERALGLSRLVVHTAGTQNYSVVVPGLRRATAEHLRDRIRALLADRDAP